MVTFSSFTPGRSVPAAFAVLLTAVTVDLSLRWAWLVHPDERIARAAAATLFSGDWQLLYLRNPLAQMGPAAIALATLPHRAYVVIVALLVLPVYVCAWLLLTPTRVTALTALKWASGALAVAYCWPQYAWKGHADDALVCLGFAVTLVAIRQRRRSVAVGGVVVALFGKPTALLGIPILISICDVLLVLFIGLCIYSPFVAPDVAGFGRLAKGVMQMAPGSFWAILHLAEGPVPWYVRPAQFVLGTLGAVGGRLSREPQLGLLLAFTIRSAMEMNPAPSYAISVVVAAFLADQIETLKIPILTVTAFAAFAVSQSALDTGNGLPRLLLHLALIGLTIRILKNRRHGPGLGLPDARDRLEGATATRSSSPAT